MQKLTNKYYICSLNENSVLSEAINAVNINSSILSNEPLGNKPGLNCQGPPLFPRQPGEPEFKLPLQIRRMDSTFSKSQVRQKSRIFSFGGRKERRDISMLQQKSSCEGRAYKQYAGESCSGIDQGADADHGRSQADLSDCNGPYEKQVPFRGAEI